MASDHTQSTAPNKDAALYQKAITAYKAQAYDQAIAYFRQLHQRTPTSTYGVKAQMGLVRSHQRLGQVTEARRLCQALQTSQSDSVRQWASQTLSQLPAPAATAPPDPTGFVPLEDTPRPGAPAPPPPSPPVGHGVEEEATIPGGPHPDVASDRIPTEGTSLFHYQHLNQQPWGPASPQPSTASPNPGPSQPQAAAPQPSPPAPAPPVGSRPSRPLPRHPLVLWLGQALTAIALLWIINWGFHGILRSLNGLIRLVRWPVRLYGIPALDQSYTVFVVGALLLLALGSPWLLDWLLRTGWGQRPLSTRQLQQQKPKVLTLLRQVCRRLDWQLPELRLINDSVPLCFSYGWHPRNLRIVVSQGLLDALSEDELVALYSYELAHAINGALGVLTPVTLLLLLCHSGYGQLGRWADQQKRGWLRGVAGLGANVLYGLYWGLRQLSLGVSRWRSIWSDRRGVTLTRQPCLLADALVKLTTALAVHSQHRGSVHPLLHSFGLLLPVSPAQALSPGSFIAGLGLDLVLVPDMANPYRQWLRGRTSHWPLGERIISLNQGAIQSGQAPLPLTALATYVPPRFSLPWLLRQKAPLVGLVMGSSLAMGLWFLGGVMQGLQLRAFSWFYQDASVLVGSLLLGLGIGLLLRINSLYPEGGNVAPPTSPLPLVTTPHPLPIQGQPVVLQGKLMGSEGPANWFGQDLYLNTPEGLLRLALPSPLSSWRGLRDRQNHPCQWIGRGATVKGWGRRAGGELWLDIDSLRLLDSGQQIQGKGPLWATLVSLGVSLWGIAIIFTGG
jgi:Zn-dependent protease with chaperone function